MPSLSLSACSFSLTPLQSKFLASFFATTLLVLVLFFVSNPRSAYSFDTSVRLPGLETLGGLELNGDFCAPRDEDCRGGGAAGGGDVDDTDIDWHEQILELQDLQELRTRDNEIVRGLGNGVPGRYNLQFGEINYWLLEPNDLYGSSTAKRGAGSELRRRDGEHGNEKRQDDNAVELYITFNTCLQPQPNQDLPESQRPIAPPPELQVFMSNTGENQAPGPAVTDKPQTVIPIIGGFGNLTITTSGSTWIGVYAPTVDDTDEWVDIWNYEIVLSTTRPYHQYIEDQFLYLIDTDDSSALLITGNMTTSSSREGGFDEDVDGDELMTRDPPYKMYAQNTGVQSRFNGLERSYCAVKGLAQTSTSDESMTRRGLGNLPKEQFHLRELNSSTTYIGFLTRPGGNGSDPDDTSGTVWRAMRINTKGDGNCQIIYNLPFCSEVAYAVPSNPTLFGIEQLTSFYDNIAESWYKNFSYSLQQVPCNASKSSAYSLARTCDDCAAAYKNWLCAVTIPRCMDYSSTLPYLAERASNELFYNATNKGLQLHPYSPTLSPASLAAHTNTTGTSVASRNKQIDQVIRPGPYKEVKPCMDLCWTLVQSCPTTFGFSCPSMKQLGGEQSYGDRDGEGDVTCSYLGAVYFLSAAGRGWSVGLGAAGWVLWMVVWTLVWEGM